MVCVFLLWHFVPGSNVKKRRTKKREHTGKQLIIHNFSVTKWNDIISAIYSKLIMENDTNLEHSVER